MTLYHYVPGRESLIDGVVETVLDELYSDPRCTSPRCMAGRTICIGWPTKSGALR